MLLSERAQPERDADQGQQGDDHERQLEPRDGWWWWRWSRDQDGLAVRGGAVQRGICRHDNVVIAAVAHGVRVVEHGDIRDVCQPADVRPRDRGRRPVDQVVVRPGRCRPIQEDAPRGAGRWSDGFQSWSPWHAGIGCQRVPRRGSSFINARIFVPYEGIVRHVIVARA